MAHPAPLVLVLALGCGEDPPVAGARDTAAPGPGLTVHIDAPEDGIRQARTHPLRLTASVRAPRGAPLDFRWTSSRDGLLSGSVRQEHGVASLQVQGSLSLGHHTLGVTVIDPQGRVGRDEVHVTVADPDVDGDGFPAAALARPGEGADCDDADPSIHPLATDRCDGVDQDCDGAIDEDAPALRWYIDADGDGAGDPDDGLVSCAAVPGRVPVEGDCDDADPRRQACRSCAALRDRGWGETDDQATIDPTGGAPFDVTCLQTAHGGGWTLVATNAGDGAWDAARILDDVPLGDGLSLDESTKSRAFAAVPFTDVLFENGLEYAIYEGVGDGTEAWQAFARAVPAPNCGAGSAWSWPAAEASLADTELCDTDLTVHPVDRDGAACELAAWEAPGLGPTWSVGGAAGCPLQAPAETGFFAGPAGRGPWDPAAPLHMWVR